MWTTGRTLALVLSTLMPLPFCEQNSVGLNVINTCISLLISYRGEAQTILKNHLVYSFSEDKNHVSKL